MQAFFLSCHLDTGGMAQDKTRPTFTYSTSPVMHPEMPFLIVG